MMMTCRMIGKEKGFTLVEVLIVALMLGLVLGSVYSLYSTNQRSAYIQDEVVDVQQNLRIAMESVTRDIRHAGFLVSRMRQAGFSAKSGIGGIAVGNNNIEQPVNTAADNSGNSVTLPVTADAFPGQPDRVHADILTLNSASPAATFAKIAQKQIGTSSAFDLIVTTSESVDNFNQDEYVRIINPTTHSQATGTAGTVYKITHLDRTVPSIQVEYVDTVAGVSPAGEEFKRDFVIAKISSLHPEVYPAAITYCLGPANGCAPGLPPQSCPSQGANDRTMCLIRLENGAPDVIASRISGLQFTYLLDDGTEVPNTGNGTAYPLVDLGAIRAIRVTITGQTASATALSGGTLGTGEKSRVMTSVIRLQNRLIQY